MKRIHPLRTLPIFLLPHQQAVGEIEPVAAETQQLSASKLRRQISRANRYARYQQILALSREGLSQRAIARQLHLSRGCVHPYVTAEQFHERALPGKRGSLLDPYLPYLHKRLPAGLPQRAATRLRDRGPGISRISLPGSATHRELASGLTCS